MDYCRFQAQPQTTPEKLLQAVVAQVGPGGGEGALAEGCPQEVHRVAPAHLHQSFVLETPSRGQRAQAERELHHADLAQPPGEIGVLAIEAEVGIIAASRFQALL